MIQLRHLRYFVGIVDAGSLSRAATTLYVAQPALSQQMAELASLQNFASALVTCGQRRRIMQALAQAAQRQVGFL